MTRVVAHRGNSAVAPQNTLAAFEAAAPNREANGEVPDPPPPPVQVLLPWLVEALPP